MSAAAGALARWLSGSSKRTFIVFPAAVFALEALVQKGMPRIDPLGLPLIAWGYLQYRWTGNYRQRLGGGGPGLSNPPLRLVTSGPYRYTRNPMYLGHLLFLAGVAVALHSWFGLLLLAALLPWFERRVRGDEARLEALFGDEYRGYAARVKRWLPGIG